METETMGRVTTEARIENLADLYDVQRGQLPDDQVRRVTVSDAMVDTGATLFSMPTGLIQQLGQEKGQTGKEGQISFLRECFLQIRANRAKRMYVPLFPAVCPPFPSCGNASCKFGQIAQKGCTSPFSLSVPFSLSHKKDVRPPFPFCTSPFPFHLYVPLFPFIILEEEYAKLL